MQTRNPTGRRSSAGVGFRWPRVGPIWLSAAFGLGYLLLAELGNALSVGPTSYSAFWPASGFYLGILIVTRPRFWPWHIPAAMAANLVSDIVFRDRSFVVAIGFTLANTVEALSGAALVRILVGPRPRIESLREFVSLILCASLLSIPLGAFLGSLTLLYTQGLPIASVWPGWWVADSLGVLMVTPLVLRLAHLKPVRPTADRVAEAVLLSALGVAACVISFGPGGVVNLPAVVILPFILWAAGRFGVEGVSVSLLIATVTMLLLLEEQSGPFVNLGNLPTRSALLQLVLSLLSIAGYMLAVVLDSQRRAELALRAANIRLEASVAERTAELASANLQLQGWTERYEAAVDASRQVLFDWDPDDDRATYAGDLGGIVGYRPDQLAHGLADWLRIIHPDDRAHVEQLANESRKTGRPLELEFRARHADGSYRYLTARGRFVGTTHPGMRRMVGFIADYTARREAENRLRSSEERFRFAAEAVDGIIYDADLLTGHVERTRGLEEVLGYRPDSVPETGQWWHEQIHPDDLPLVESQVESALAVGDRYVVEYRVRHRDGRYLHILDRSFFIRDENGRPVRQVGCSQDITEIRQAEAALRESDRRKNEFLALLAHELRNPLVPIRNGLYLLPRAVQKPGGLEPVVEMMDRQVKQLVRLIDDLLDVSRITEGKIKLQCESVELASLIKIACEALESQFEWAGLTLQLDLPKAPMPLWADPTRISQVLANLLSNAVKFTPRGGRIEVSAGQSEGHAWFRVADTGIGIEPDLLPRVFEMFMQADSSLERAQGGLGIGLPLARRLIEMHGGTIDAASQGRGLGCEFLVRIPLAATDTNLRAPRGSDPAANLDPADSPISFLVVDDNVDAVSSLRMLLEERGHSVRTASNGHEALAAVAECRPDVVLLDIGMPHMNGYEVASRIRASESGASLTLVAMTGWGQDADRRRSREAGFDYHLVKPVDPARLLTVLGVPNRPARTGIWT